jgi:hypothetical protein
MAGPEEIWLPLVDEPIGSIVRQIQEDDPEIDRLVSSPHRILPFRTFAYIRVGIVLGQLLFDNDVPPYDGSETWVDALLREPKHHEALVNEVRAVDEGPLGPDEDARERFKDFARKQLAQDV